MKSILGAFLAIFVSTTASTAATIQLVAEGIVSSSTTASAPTGSSARLEVLYDSSAPDISTMPSFGLYAGEAILAATLSVGTITLTSDPEPPGRFPSTSFIVSNDADVAFGGDQLSITLVDLDAPNLGEQSEFTLFVLDESGGLISSNALPTSLTLENTVDNFDFTRIAILLGISDGINVDITSLSASPLTPSISQVPLPGSLPLLAAGFGLLGLARRRSNPIGVSKF